MSTAVHFEGDARCPCGCAVAEMRREGRHILRNGAVVDWYDTEDQAEAALLRAVEEEAAGRAHVARLREASDALKAERADRERKVRLVTHGGEPLGRADWTDQERIDNVEELEGRDKLGY